jgi:hypothetical protein
MSESPQQKTTRKVVAAMRKYDLFHQATIYLFGDAETNKRTIARLKRLITEENKDDGAIIMYFISRGADKSIDDETGNPSGEIVPYISFRSEQRIKGSKVIAAEKNLNDDKLFKVVGSAKHKNYISTNMEKRYAGTIKSIKDHGVYDLSIVELPIRINRFGFLNKTKNN